MQLFSGSVSGLAVQLPGWKYPAVFQLGSGQVQCDNYGGAWGEQRQLDRFLQTYAVELAKIEARRRGHTVTEQPLLDGSIKLTILVIAFVALASAMTVAVAMHRIREEAARPAPPDVQGIREVMGRIDESLAVLEPPPARLATQPAQPD